MAGQNGRNILTTKNLWT